MPTPIGASSSIYGCLLIVLSLAFLVVISQRGDEMSATAQLARAFRIVYVTVPSQEVGSLIARKVVSEKVAACVNIVPGIKSIYTWKGEVQEDNELLLIIKTSAAQVDGLRKIVHESHPYEVPEFLVLPLEDGSEKYLNWMREALPDDIVTTSKSPK